MSVATDTNTATSCPSCGYPGKTVQLVTLEHLLTADALASVEPEARYRHCARAGCDVAYYAESGPTIPLRAVTVAIGSKETEGPRQLCYCFDHSYASIEEQLKQSGTTDVVETITAHCRAGEDRCDQTNPQGSCCLGNVRRAVKESKAKLHVLDEDAAQPAQPSAAVPDCCASDGACAVPEPDTAERVDGRPSIGADSGVLAAGGALTAAVLSSACCWLPLLLIALGAGTTTVAGALEQYRAYFLVAAAGLLGAGYYFVWFRKEQCAPGEACEVPRPRLKLFNRITLSIATVLVAGFAFFPSYIGAFIGGAGEPPAATAIAAGTSRVLAVEGMTCEACSAHIRSELEAVPGVKSAFVSYPDKSATVVLEHEIPDAALFSAVEAAGYSASLKE